MIIWLKKLISYHYKFFGTIINQYIFKTQIGMGHPYSYYLFIFTILTKFNFYLQTTPLCNICPCNSKPNEPPVIYCDIGNISEIYNKTFFYDNKNGTYPIESLTIKSKNLERLMTQFPQSDLKLLDLSSNEIDELGIGIFGQLQNMESLILADNNIKQINPHTFRGIYTKNEYFPLRSLQKLDLSNNKIVTLNADTFEHIDELRELVLSGNPLQAIDAPTLTATASLVNLQILDVSKTQIKELPESFMFVLKNLKYLDLSGNSLGSIPPTLNESTTLETLILSNNPIEKLVEENIFPNMESLKVLYLSEMPQLRVIGSHALGGLKSLTELHVCNNSYLTHIHPHAMIRVHGTQELSPPLEKVYLNNNNLSYIDEELLLDFKNLKILDISNNPFTCGCRNQWLINDLIPYYEENNNTEASKQYICYHPAEFKGQSLFTLYQRKISLTCLDVYGNEEKHSFWLIAAVSGILTGILLCMLIFYVLRAKAANYQFMYTSLQNIRSSRV